MCGAGVGLIAYFVTSTTLADTLVISLTAALAGLGVAWMGEAGERDALLRAHDAEAGRARAQAAQQSAEQTVSAMIGALGDPAVLMDDDYLVEALNPPARALFGDKLLGQSMTMFLRHPEALDALATAAATGRPQRREVHLLSPIERSYEVHIAPVTLQPVRLLAVLRDITRQRLTERMRADFVANASHELRTPLTTLVGFVETLRGPAADDADARARFLSIMDKEANRMVRLIDDLLSLSRIELDKADVPDQPVAIGPLIADVRKALAMRLEANGRDLRVQMADGLPALLGDRDQIMQVLYNLVFNALKYGRAETPIEVIVAPPEAAEGDAPARIAITVADQGDGIAPEHLPRLTERFYRVDTNRSRTLGGTGLGLAIVKHIIERHRGRLDIESIVGKGTRVTFTLPCVRR